MHWFGEIAQFCNRFEVRMIAAAAAALVLALWLLVHLAKPAPTATVQGSHGQRWLWGGLVLALILPCIQVGSSLVAAGMTLLVVATTELILRTQDRALAARRWELMLAFALWPLFCGSTQSTARPMADQGHPWELVACTGLWLASWLTAAFVAMAPERRARARRALPVFALLGFVLSLMALRTAYDPDQEIPRAARPSSTFAVHELPARADLVSALAWQHRPLPRLPAELGRLRPFDANLQALAATLQADAVTEPEREELRRSLPLAELLTRRSEPAALVVAASLYFDEVRGPAHASWRVELEHRWTLALAAEHRRLPQLRQVLEAAILSHESDFQAGRQQLVQAALRRLWGPNLRWRGFLGGMPGFRAQETSELYDPESTSAGVWLARAYGWPEGIDPQALRRALLAAGSRSWVQACMPPSHENLHDAASLAMLRPLGSQPTTTEDFLRNWLDALTTLIASLTLCLAGCRARRRFPEETAQSRAVPGQPATGGSRLAARATRGLPMARSGLALRSAGPDGELPRK